MSKKIFCTLGPASMKPPILRRFADLGVDLLRINLSHTQTYQIEPWVDLIRAHTQVPICLDTQGAQVRTGNLTQGSTTVVADAMVELVPAPAIGDGEHLPLYPQHIVGALRVGDLVSVDFNSVLLQVVSTSPTCIARVLASGLVGSNKAVTIDAEIPLDPINSADRDAIGIGRRLGLGDFALSFANRRSDVETMRQLVGPDSQIIAKVESRLALKNLEDILQTADGILIDRGDLSREVPLETVPLLQKRIIRAANRSGRPVYVATNLLESMVTSPRPTRAEVNDVINTLFDGADGLVLAAETAIGQHPIGCVSMVRSLIDQYERRGVHDQDTIWSEGHLSTTSRLIRPHGGSLVARVARAGRSDISRLARLVVDDRVMMDVRQIATGGFSPLSGFLDREALTSVLASHRLPDGTVWPMPVVLQIPGDAQNVCVAGEVVALEHHQDVRATLTVTESFSWDARNLAARWFGTTSVDHPGVARLLAGGDRFVAGKVELLADELRHREAFELTPTQARLVFEHRQWCKVVGFHTRNVPHRAHEHIQLAALAHHDCDGIFVHPVIGPKITGDYSGDIILKAYQLLIERFYPPNSAVVSGWATYSRYAGPREALFTALVRQNYGCSHFVIGRDHTGVGTFYSADESRRICESLAADIGVTLAFANEIYFCPACQDYVDACGHGPGSAMQISGTEARDMLRSGAVLPDWFMRESVSRLILDEIKEGHEVFVC